MRSSAITLGCKIISDKKAPEGAFFIFAKFFASIEAGPSESSFNENTLSGADFLMKVLRNSRCPSPLQMG